MYPSHTHTTHTQRIRLAFGAHSHRVSPEMLVMSYVRLEVNARSYLLMMLD